MSPVQTSTSIALPRWPTSSLGPRELSVDPTSRAIARLLEEHVVQPGAAPGATAGVARRVGGEWRWAVGAAGLSDPFDGDPVTPDTWFDLASLTKSITALAVARAVDRGRMGWESRLEQYLPSVSGTFGGEATLLSLLSHRAGFVAHTLVPDGSAESLRNLAGAHRQDLPARGAADPIEPYAPVYSDVGYILAGAALATCIGRPLDVQFEAELADLAAGTTSAVPAWETRLASARPLLERGISIASVAPTEVLSTRGGLVRGLVHDDNAWTLSETSTSGHAGMFGTAAGVLGLGICLIELTSGRSTCVSPASQSALLSPRSDGSLRAGFDSKNVDGPSVAGTVLGPRTFGHLGFTGTSYWCDPEAEIVVVLLTNRVCPSRDNLQLRAARPLVHDGLARLASEFG